MGRPDGPDRERRARVDGVQDLRLRGRPRRRVGAGGSQLGLRSDLARRRTLQRRPPAGESAGGGADGPHLRQPRGAERHAGPGQGRPRHPRDVPPHGDERRGDGGADRRRPHLRQDARRGAPGPARRGRSGRRQHRGTGLRLEERVRHGERRGCHHQRHRGHLDHAPDALESRLLHAPVRVRLGAQ